MTAFIEIPFPLGEPLWTPSFDRNETWIQCPECAGTKVLTLIQGNGNQVSIDCACCQQGYQEPTGMVKRIEYLSVPVGFIPRRVEMCGSEFRYSESPPDASCFTHRSASDLFKDYAACAARCAILNEERMAEDERRAVANLASKRRDMAWSVHYWGRKVQELERDLVVARGRLDAIKQGRRS